MAKAVVKIEVGLQPSRRLLFPRQSSLLNMGSGSIRDRGHRLSGYVGVWNDRGGGRPGQDSAGGGGADDGGYRESRRPQGGGDERPQISRSMFGSAQVHTFVLGSTE